MKKPGGWFTKNVHEKQLWKSGILSKDAGRWHASLLKISLLRKCFAHILLLKTNNLFFPQLQRWLEKRNENT